MTNAALKRRERAVLRAALACVDKKGFAFMYARHDVTLYVIDRAKFQRLEAAVAALREERKRGRG